MTIARSLYLCAITDDNVSVLGAVDRGSRKNVGETAASAAATLESRKRKGNERTYTLPSLSQYYLVTTHSSYLTILIFFVICPCAVSCI
jgi:hypothetical protein